MATKMKCWARCRSWSVKALIRYGMVRQSFELGPVSSTSTVRAERKMRRVVPTWSNDRSVPLSPTAGLCEIVVVVVVSSRSNSKSFKDGFDGWWRTRSSLSSTGLFAHEGGRVLARPQASNERYDSTACLRHDRTPSTRQTQSFAAGEGAAVGAVAEYKGKGILTAGVAADREMREGGVPKEPSVRYQVL